VALGVDLTLALDLLLPRKCLHTRIHVSSIDAHTPTHTHTQTAPGSHQGRRERRDERGNGGVDGTLWWVVAGAFRDVAVLGCGGERAEQLRGRGRGESGLTWRFCEFCWRSSERSILLFSCVFSSTLASAAACFSATWRRSCRTHPAVRLNREGSRPESSLLYVVQ
jgi:hypothetical protein